MRFIISKNELNELVSKVQNIVSVKAPVPILSNFLIEAKENQIVLTATDLTVGVKCLGLAKVLESGSTTLPAKRFAQLVRELTASNIEIHTNSKDITQITAESSSFKMHGMPRAEFPALPDLSGATRISMPQKELKDMFYRTSFAVSREENRFVLTGVYIQIVNNTAIFVGTDGKRLSRAHLPIDVDVGLSGEYIIPLKAVEEIIKNLSSDEDSAVVYLMPDKIAIEANNILIMTKLLSGDYPDVERVIPSRSNHVVSLHREELMTLLRQVSLFTSEASHSVRFSFSSGSLQLTANTTDIGEGRVSMPVNYHGEKFDIAFNPVFFLDILRHSKQETVTVGFTDPFNPGIVTDGEQLTSDQGNLMTPLFVIMPMRLNEE